VAIRYAARAGERTAVGPTKRLIGRILAVILVVSASVIHASSDISDWFAIALWIALYPVAFHCDIGGDWTGEKTRRFNTHPVKREIEEAINAGFEAGRDARRKVSVDDQDQYERLVALQGCGPVTAQRIISKVQAGQKLTNHEQNFWQQVQ
jgi:hypothetical protein